MAPKRHVAPPTRGMWAVRKVARRAPLSPSSSSYSSEQGTAVGSSSSNPNPMAGRVITSGRKVLFDFLLHEGFSFGMKLRNLGWERLCSLDELTYPALVREFYASTSRGEGGLIGSVRGRTVKVNQSILCSLLDMPCEGIAPHSYSNRAGALSAMLGREVGELEEVSANQFLVELRLLHNICWRVLFPKTGRFDFISEKDVVLMGCILNEHPINLPGMMIGYMGEACNKKKACLPYGMVLTLAFRAQGVVISENEPKRLLRHTDYYNESTLRRMGYRKVEGIWEKRGQAAQVRSDEAEANPIVSTAAHSPPPTAAPASPPFAPAAPAAAGPSTSSAPAPSMTDEMFIKIRDMIREEQSVIRDHISQEHA